MHIPMVMQVIQRYDIHTHGNASNSALYHTHGNASNSALCHTHGNASIQRYVIPMVMQVIQRYVIPMVMQVIQSSVIPITQAIQRFVILMYCSTLTVIYSTWFYRTIRESSERSNFNHY